MRFLRVICLLVCVGCAFKRSRPCTDGGDPALSAPTGGTKQCETVEDPSGKTVINGKYKEWYKNGFLAVDGHYMMGKKHGKWLEYDDTGKKISEKYFDYGKEVDRFDTPAKKILGHEAAGKDSK